VIVYLKPLSACYASKGTRHLHHLLALVCSSLVNMAVLLK